MNEHEKEFYQEYMRKSADAVSVAVRKLRQFSMAARRAGVAFSGYRHAQREIDKSERLR